MKTHYLRSLMILLCAFVLLFGVSPVGQAESPGAGDGNKIYLQAVTFDPLQAEPDIPQNLKLTGYAESKAGPYIVQFVGPINSTWKEAVSAVGGQIDSYLPDNALIVRLDNNSLVQVKQLDFVRWVGLYQPAYKLSPQLTASPTHLYRIRLAGWADAGEVGNQLAAVSHGVTGKGASLVVAAEFDQLAQIAQQPDVLWIEAFTFFEKQNDIADGIMNANTAWTAGYTGNGQTVTIADTGLDTGVDTAAIGDIHLDFDNRAAHISSWPVVPYPNCIANPGADDGASDKDSGHGTHVAGSVGGNGARSGGLYKGPAYQATLTFQAVEQYTTFTGTCAGYAPDYYLMGIPDDLNDLFLEAYNWGSRIHTNSWGSDAAGAYTTSSQQADQFAWDHKNFAILFSAGNEGVDANWNGYVDEDSIGSPATAKNVITIGASENNRSSGGYNPGGPCSSWGDCWPSDFPTDPTSSDLPSDNPQHMAAFSSRGPTDDGRIKPDLVAPGSNILSTRSSLITGYGWGPGPSSYYMYMGGTSMATPLSAGATAVVRDYLVDGAGVTNPSSALINAIVINSAVDISGYGNTAQEAGQYIPNNHEGWGRIDLASAVNGTNRALVDNQSLEYGVTHIYTFTVTNSATPLKASVVWSDYPGNPAASIQLVNNLNLKVIAPDGSTTYYGNHFSSGWSTTGGSADSRNNVENVYRQSPATGQWRIEIRGANVPYGPQPYALVVRGQGTLVGPVIVAAPPLDNEIYLPIIMASGSGGSGGSVPANGDFEQGPVAWTEYSSNGWDLIEPAADLLVTPHGGNWAVWLGGDDDEEAYIRQAVTVPSSTPYLTYWHWIDSEDACGYDYGGVGVGGSWLDSYDLCESSNTNGWVRHTTYMGAYAGQTINLDIVAVTDSSLNSNLFIDDVSFQATATSTDTAMPEWTPPLDAAAPRERNSVPKISNGDAEYQYFVPRPEKQ